MSYMQIRTKGLIISNVVSFTTNHEFDMFVASQENKDDNGRISKTYLVPKDHLKSIMLTDNLRSVVDTQFLMESAAMRALQPMFINRLDIEHDFFWHVKKDFYVPHHYLVWYKNPRHVTPNLFGEYSTEMLKMSRNAKWSKAMIYVDLYDLDRKAEVENVLKSRISFNGLWFMNVKNNIETFKSWCRFALPIIYNPENDGIETFVKPLGRIINTHLDHHEINFHSQIPFDFFESEVHTNFRDLREINTTMTLAGYEQL